MRVKPAISHADIHDAAIGKAAAPEPTPRPTRRLHPAMQQRAQAVKAAHAHLSKTVPGFRSKPGREQIAHTQAHVKKATPGGY
jgi:hypothetical protein